MLNGVRRARAIGDPSEQMTGYQALFKVTLDSMRHIELLT